MQTAWIEFVGFLGLGLVFGSFANVVIWRFPRGESLAHPASRCPSCDTPIAWRDNVPVLSWVLLGGRCRSCRTAISARYPAVEVASGALWVLAWVLWGVSLRTAFGISFFYLLLILAVIDMDTFRLPNPIVGTLGFIGALGVIFSAATGKAAVPLIESASPIAFALWGAVGSAGLALFIALVYSVARKREGFGMGDVKLLAVMGLFLGLYGVLVLFVASVVGAVVGVWQGLRSDSGLSGKMPFGPYLAAAAVLVVVWGPAIWMWYAGLISCRESQKSNEGAQVMTCRTDNRRDRVCMSSLSVP